MEDYDAREAAVALADAWHRGGKLLRLDSRVTPSDLDEAWKIQRLLDDRMGPAAGWKLAATSPGGQQQMGSAGPLLGRVYASTVHPSGARVVSAQLSMLTAEAEFAFRIASDLDMDSTHMTSEVVLDAVASLHPAIEIPDSRFVDFTTVGLPSLVADGMCAGYLIIGAAATTWDPGSLSFVPVSMMVNGIEVATGTGANVLGDPCVALRWAAQELMNRGTPLRKGDVVTTGASTPPNVISAGDELTACFGALGEVDVMVGPS